MDNLREYDVLALLRTSATPDVRGYFSDSARERSPSCRASRRRPRLRIIATAHQVRPIRKSTTRNGMTIATTDRPMLAPSSTVETTGAAVPTVATFSTGRAAD